MAGAGPGPTEGFTEKNVPGEVGELGRVGEWYSQVVLFPGLIPVFYFLPQKAPHIPPVKVSHLRQL